MADSTIPRSDSAQRLKSALENAGTGELRVARTRVENELGQFAASVPPPDFDRARETLTASDIEDLQEAGKIATDFLTGMDRIADVLMLLVLKFGRASTLMRVVLVGIVIGIILLAANIFAIWNISNTQTEIQIKQGKIQEQQTQILRVAGDASRKAESAEQKIAQVQQSAPEVVVDSRGGAQLILTVPDPAGKSEPTQRVIKLPKSVPLVQKSSPVSK